MKETQTNLYLVDKNVVLSGLPLKIETLKNFDFEKELEKTRKKLSKFQDTMYAHNKYAVLICLQGMDTSGKDSLIREIFKDFNARGVVVHSFKVPSSTELEHDFLWRHYIALPEKGKFAVFNRTHYENVLVTRVHTEYIFGENLPEINTVCDIDDDFWQKRFDQINNFEKHLTENGTIVLKFFLNISKGEQAKRLLHRLENPEDNWKFSAGDMKERQLWDKYMMFYEDAINKTSTIGAPWHIVPADDKASCRYIVAKIILERLQLLTDVKEPTLDIKTLASLQLFKDELKKKV